MRALGLPAQAVEDALLSLVPRAGIGRLLDVGSGTGRLLELLAPRVGQAVGIDASKAMVALARARLARAGLSHCTVRLADMYRLPLPDAGFDAVVLQMVLHYAEDPASALAEAARVLRPGGTLIVADLAPHERSDLMQRLAHRWPGFADERMRELLEAAGLNPDEPIAIAGPLDVRIWRSVRTQEAGRAQPVAGATLSATGIPA